MHVGRISFDAALTLDAVHAMIASVLLAERPSPLSPCSGWQPGTGPACPDHRGQSYARSSTFRAKRPRPDLAASPPPGGIFPGIARVSEAFPPPSPRASVRAPSKNEGTNSRGPKRGPELTLTHPPAFGTLSSDVIRPYAKDALCLTLNVCRQKSKPEIAVACLPSKCLPPYAFNAWSQNHGTLLFGAPGQR